VVFGGGKARVELVRQPVSPTEAGTVSTDIATLSGLFGGALKASLAERMGRLTGDEASLALLDAAFATPPLIITRTDWF
jgi:hypothetical protein